MVSIANPLFDVTARSLSQPSYAVNIDQSQSKTSLGIEMNGGDRRNVRAFPAHV
jgi:hypothetical protein